MLRELTAGRLSRAPLSMRALTPFVCGVAGLLLKWEPVGAIVVELPTGRRMQFGRSETAHPAHLKLNSYRVLWQALRRGSIGFAESYMDEDVESDGLEALFHFFLRNRDKLHRSGDWLFRTRAGDRLAHFLRRNSRKGSRRNIAEHYDLGDAFYRPWLDAEMNYSSGLYAGGARDLESAQHAKLDAALDLLGLKGGESIFEIGCGWGAFARRAAQRHDAKVTGITLSHEQFAYARQEAAALGLDDQCDFRLEDYRDTQGSYDRIVSIEMVEAVGEENWPRYFETLRNRLKPGGLAVLQAITIGEDLFPRYRRKADFIQRHIFPGGLLPTASAIGEQAGNAGLKLETVKTFGPCYARTLGEWRERFEQAWPEISRLGFDERFRRKWLYYLSYCKAGFENGAIDVGFYQLRRV